MTKRKIDEGIGIGCLIYLLVALIPAIIWTILAAILAAVYHWPWFVVPIVFAVAYPLCFVAVTWVGVGRLMR